jgi:uncharacterized protein (DUF1697 family)
LIIQITEEITVKITEDITEVILKTMQILTEFRLRKEQNLQEVILTTEQVHHDKKHLKTHNVLKLREQARNQEAVNLNVKAAQATEAMVEEEVNIKIAFSDKKQKHNLTIVLFFIFLIIIDANLF